MPYRRSRENDKAYELKKKNAIELGDDSNLDNDFKPIKIGGESSIINLSKSSLDINGNFRINGEEVSTGSAGATQLSELSDVTYSSGDLTISSLDTIVASSDLTLDCGGDIFLDAEGTDIKFLVGGTSYLEWSATGSLNMKSVLDTGDAATLAVGAHGAFQISTLDDDASAGHITVNADGDIILDAVCGNGTGIFLKDEDTTFGKFDIHHSATYFTLYENGGASTDDYMSLYVKEHGETYILTTDAASSAANFRCHIDGDIMLNPYGGGDVKVYNDAGYNTLLHNFSGASHYLAEQADANGNSDGFGQIWIHDDNPNTLWFTNDNGDDIQITDGSELYQKYVYETKFIGYNASATTVYLPMNGYIIERTSTTGNNEFVSFVAPYNGTIEKFAFRSEIAQDGNFRILIAESSDGTEIPGSASFRKDATYDIADDTYQELALTSPGVGSSNAPMTKGKIYLIELTTPSLSSDTNVTIVFKWDITS